VRKKSRTNRQLRGGGGARRVSLLRTLREKENKKRRPFNYEHAHGRKTGTVENDDEAIREVGLKKRRDPGM